MTKRILDFIFCYFMLALMWVGAECLFEGAIHSSGVDAVVCAILAKFVWLEMDGE